jgi:hypothetical protein
VKCFETSPEGMGRVREAAVNKRVAHQEVTEFVMNAGVRNRQPAKQRETQRNYKKKQAQDGKEFVSRKAGEETFDTPKEPLRTAREKNRGQPKRERKQNRNGWLGEPSGSGGIHQEFGKSPGKNTTAGDSGLHCSR